MRDKNNNFPIRISYEKISFILLSSYLIFFSFWPFYLDYRIIENVGVNPERICLITFISIVFIFFLTSKKYRVNSLAKIKKIPEINFFIFIYLLLRIASCIASSEKIGFYYVVNEVVVNYALFYAVYVSGSSFENNRKLLRILFLCVFIVSIYGIVEYLLEVNYFRLLITKETSSSIVAMAEKWREGSYRIQSTFEHPLSLSQFIVLLLPTSLIPSFVVKNSFLRGLVVLCALLASYLTYTRSSIVVICVVLCIFLFVRFNNLNVTHSSRALLGILKFVLVCLFAIILYFGLTPYIVGKNLQEAQSTGTRIVQIVNGVIAIKGSPYLGYGPGSASRVIKDVSLEGDKEFRIYTETIDNLFLSKAIDSGLPTAFSYLMILLCLARRIYKSLSSCYNDRLKIYLTWSFCGVVGTIISMVVLSIFTILPLFFIISAIALNLSNSCFLKTNKPFTV